jgi:Holliday junction resolvase-like predicted endonuclease
MLRELAARWIVEHGRTASHVRIDVVALHQQGSGFVIEHARAVG